MGIGEFIASGLTGLFLYALFIKPIFETIDEHRGKKAKQPPKPKSRAQLKKEANVAAMYERARRHDEGMGYLTKEEREDAVLDAEAAIWLAGRRS